MKYLPFILIILIFTIPAITLLNLRRETGLKQMGEYKKVFFHSKQDFFFSFISPKEKLNSVILKIWNLSIDNNKPIYFKLLSNQKTIRQLILNDANIINGDMVRFSFPEITDSKNKSFTVVLSAPDTKKDDVLGVYTDANNYPVIITYHTPSSKLKLILDVYKNFGIKLVSDRIFILMWLIMLGSTVLIIRKLDI